MPAAVAKATAKPTAAPLKPAAKPAPAPEKPAAKPPAAPAQPVEKPAKAPAKPAAAATPVTKPPTTAKTAAVAKPAPAAKPAKSAPTAVEVAVATPAPVTAPTAPAHVPINFIPDKKMIDEIFAAKSDMKKIHKIVTRCDKAQVKLTVELIELVFCPSCPLDAFDKCCVLEFIIRHHEYIKTADCIRMHVVFAKSHHCVICDHPGHNERHCWDRVRSGSV